MPIADFLQPDLKGLTTGEILKKELGLTAFNTIWIRKIIDLPMHVYFVYFNSRYPTSYLAMSQVKNLETITVNRMMQSGLAHKQKPYKYTPPIPLEDFNAKIPSNSMMFRIDITGEYFANKKLYEEINIEYFKTNKILLG